MSGPPPAGVPLERAPRSVALVRLSSLGDLVRVLPVIASLRRRWPGIEVAWAVEEGPHALVAGHPMVDRLLVLRRGRGPWGHLALWRETRGTAYDLVLDLHRYFKAGLVSALLDAPVKVGFDRGRSADLNWLFTTHQIPPGPRRHVQEEYFEFLRYLEVPVVEEWPLPLTEEERARQRSLRARFDREPLGVLLCSSVDEKDWPVERWARALEAATHDLGMQPVLVGGRSDREDRRAARLRELADVEPLDAREQDVRRLLWVADACSVFAGPDSGPLHIAAGAGTPTVGLYGYSDPRRHGPYGPLGRMEELQVDRYGKRGEVPSDELRPGRMGLVTVEEVVEKIERARGFGEAS